MSLQSPRNRSPSVNSYSRMPGNDCWKKYVFSLLQKSVREAYDWISGGKLFQRIDAATGKWMSANGS